MGWYLIALFGVPAAATLIAIAIYGTEAVESPPGGWPRALGAVFVVFVLQLVLFQLAEEIGWTGFLQDRWQDRYSPLKLSAMVALPWAVWHLPDFFVDEGLGIEQLAIAPVFLVFEFISLFFARVLIVWLYDRTGRSVLVVAIFHASFDASISELSFDIIPGSDVARFLVISGVIVIAATAVIVATRGRFAQGPRFARNDLGALSARDERDARREQPEQKIMSARNPMPSWTENAPSRANDAPATSESAAAANPNQPSATGATRVRMIPAEAAARKNASGTWAKLRKQARSEIERHVAALSSQVGLSPGRLYVMGQRTKWGNCSARRNLSFNWRLILAPEFVLKYIVTHEIMHLQMPDHSARFWLAVQSAFPATESARRWLSANGPRLFEPLPPLENEG